MAMRSKLALVLATALLVGVIGGAQAGAAKTLWKDASGDVDFGGSGPTPVGDASGFDLASGSITRKGANLVFTVKHASMPPFGEIPEAFRFMWGFTVNGKPFRVPAKRVEIGKPNPMTQEDTDQIGKVSPDGFFRLEGNCGSTVVGALNAINCHTLGYLKGVWDPAKSSFSFSVPMKVVKAKPGSKVGPGAGEEITICSICWVTHTAERSLDSTIVDSAAQTTTYKVPR
jgi:hypothetical protein